MTRETIEQAWQVLERTALKPEVGEDHRESCRWAFYAAFKAARDQLVACENGEQILAWFAGVTADLDDFRRRTLIPRVVNEAIEKARRG